eukprot:m.189278 g.189278  ORF g.189278 m.189278 type:complete len:54 (-) comp16938_c1_seq48:1640-1801(-)
MRSPEAAFKLIDTTAAAPNAVGTMPIHDNEPSTLANDRQWMHLSDSHLDDYER